MKYRTFIISLLLTLIIGGLVYFFTQKKTAKVYSVEDLRELYSSGNSKKWPLPSLFPEIEDEYVEIGVLADIKHPAANPFSEEKAILGQQLFFEPRLSKSKQVSCASCHEPQLAWADGKRVANGDFQEQGNRNTPTIINIGFAKSLFWDGRSPTLEDQVHEPIEDSVEMNTKFETAINNIRNIRGYEALFIAAFGDKKVTEDRVSMALATYQRSIKSTRSKFDLFIEGQSDEFTDEQVLGLHLFRTKGKCVNCHYSPYFSDQKFHNVGLTYYGRFYQDLGLYNHTQKKEDVGKFKTPTLREVGKSGPYMHNGLFPDLEGIMNMYNAGMPRPRRKASQENDSLFPTTSHLLQPLKLTEKDKKAIESFLHTLSSRRAGIEIFLNEVK
jgi:cytochrome c peroxidase